MDKIEGSFVCVTRTFPSGVTYCVERAEEGRDSILCTAALLGHTNCVRILVEYREADVEELGSGANPNGETSFNGTPLQAACALGYFEIVRLLEEHGAYIEAADNRAVTCLMLASFGGHLEIVKYLLEVHPADVNGKKHRRYVNGELIHPKTQDNSSCPSDGEFSEVNTLEELESIESDLKKFNCRHFS
ncbi:protein fem-1 homolog B-like [Macrobrachium nipponense]|uniref:protein fem-1 homolog B-like n=1 Tax=Macrobrachium nipponense TaxID=159736 RepID=UPI0030C81B33